MTFVVNDGTTATTVEIAGAGQTLDTVASSLQAALGGDFEVRFINASSPHSADAFIDINPAAAGFVPGFYVTRSTPGAPVTSLALEIVDAGAARTTVQTVSDAAAATAYGSFPQAASVDRSPLITQVQQGTRTLATFNMDTTAQTRTNSVVYQAAHDAVTIANLATLTQNTAGADVSALMTTANGVQIGLTQLSATLSGAVTLELDSDAKARGYERFYAQITSDVGTAGGVVAFDLSNGAEFQVGPNSSQRVGVIIDSVAASELGRNVAGAQKLLSLEDLVSTRKGALINGMQSEALRVLDSVIDEVTNMRGRIGAVQSNTLETGLNSLRATTENMTSAESVIRDADFAAESAEFTRYNILVQSSTSMLAQANNLPQNVLQLLQQ